MRVLVIIPCFNEEKNIVDTVNRVKEKYDYIVINDGSTDKSLKVLQKHKFNYINLINNVGIGGAMQVGYKYASKEGYDIAIQFDGDGQHQAKELKKLVDGIEEGLDIVIGSRFVEKNKPRTIRMLGSNLISLIIKIITRRKIKDPTSGMRAYNKEIINEFVNNSGLTPEPDMLVYMLKKGKKIKEVQVEMKNRELGESYLKPLRAMKYMINVFCSIVFIRSFTKKV